MHNLIDKLRRKGVFEVKDETANEAPPAVELKGAILAMISGGYGGSDMSQASKGSYGGGGGYGGSQQDKGDPQLRGSQP